MAGSNPGKSQGKKSSKQRGRLGPGLVQSSSRVSKVVGGGRVQVEQRANHAAQKSSARGSSSPAAKRGQARSKAGAKKAGPGRSAVAPSPPPGSTTDSRLISAIRNAWSSLEPHHQQRLLSVLLLGLALFLFAVLTLLRRIRIFGAISGAFTTFFGWSAYLLALGLIVFAIAHLVEGLRNVRFIRWSLVSGLTCLWLLALVESQLLLGGTTGGVLGELLVRPLAGWPAIVGHLVLIGLFGIVTIITFQITLGHILFLARGLGLLSSPGSQSALARNGPSPFRGQRPRYSRYVSNPASSDPQAARTEAVEEDGDLTEFEPAFAGAHDDPLNDINIHKQQVGRLPREARAARPLNVAEHNRAVAGARQQALPFEREAQNHPPMEPLVPNPLRRQQPRVLPRRVAETPVLELPWHIPATSLLNNSEEVKQYMLGDDTSTLAKTIQDTLRSFRVDAEVKQEDISIGPTVIRFGIRPTGKPEMKRDEKGRSTPVRDGNGNIVYETRTRVSRIMALQNDLALVLEAKTIRMEAPVPGRPYVGVEIPNKNSRLVTLREVLESKEYQAARVKSKLAVALGKDVAGAVRVGDLARMPHLLIAGATGAGKSVCINTIIASILTQATPDDVRMLMVDPKMVELNMYSGIPHLLSPVVTEVEKVVPLLKNAIAEMERRYRLFSQLGVRNLDGYRKLRVEKAAQGDISLKNLPAIVIVIDELADLMMAAPEEVEGMICRLAQLARATGIHLVIATQRPSVDVITGLIKANIPTRISFMVSSAVDSRTIIDMGGAERLLGRGDMLYLPADAGRPERIQGAFLADDEAETLVTYWRQQALQHMPVAQGEAAAPEVEPGWEIREQSSDDFELEDDLLDKAEEVVREYERASISLLQRRLRIGYSRAARLIDLLEERGIIGSSEAGGRAREVLDGGAGRPEGDRRWGGGGGEGRTIADEVTDIIAGEKAREEFLKKQALRGQATGPGNESAHTQGRGTED